MRHPIVMVMGVAGSGKTTIGKALAKALDARFLDGYDYHTKATIAHIMAGRVLTDAMRWPWLDAVGDAVKTASADTPVVFACSGLNRIHRDYLRAGLRYRLVYPEATLAEVQRRFKQMGKRSISGRFLRAQFELLTPPIKDEAPIIVDFKDPVETIIAEITLQLQQN